MDGNRRWAKAHGMPTLQGHKRGYDQALVISEHAFQRGVKYVTLFAFSTENWNRSREEVGYLMRLLRRMLTKESKVLHAKNIRLLVIGSTERVSKDMLKAIDQVQRLTEKNARGTLLIAFNYGGRKELLDALTRLMKDARSSASVSEIQIYKHLYTAGIPDPDLIIRTSGEQRLSGFLLWQSAYSELYFTNTLWPAFTTKHFDNALKEYTKRQRRFGK